MQLIRSCFARFGRGCLAAMALGLGLATVTTSASAQTQTLEISEADLVPVGTMGWVAPRITLPQVDPDLPLVRQHLEAPGTRILLRTGAQGRAAGFQGVLYDNRDRGHSTLPNGLFPQLAHITYDDALREKELDQGLGGAIVYPAIVLGNSSTVVSGDMFARSLPRWAMTRPGLPSRSYRSYISNHLYIYPEHEDHDARDKFPAQWPYMVITQGSSSSDQPFLQALLKTLAAFSPETRAKLEKEGLVAPTLQMILRRTLQPVRARETYLSPKAHPTVFEESQLTPDRMVSLAAGLGPDEIPPMVRLEIETEDFAPEAGLGQMTELLFDTPSAIARIWRSDAWQREMVVSAARTNDPNGRALRFSWVVLRGDPSKVAITPLDDTGSRARLRFTWQDAQPSKVIGGIDQPEMSRIDIGVFANNGRHDSAPAIISVSYPTHEQRRYAPGETGEMTLVDVDYNAQAAGRSYDPALHWTAAWRDSYVSDGSKPTGWWRFTETGAQQLSDTTERPAEETHLEIGPEHMVLLEGPYPDEG